MNNELEERLKETSLNQQQQDFVKSVYDELLTFAEDKECTQYLDTFVLPKEDYENTFAFGTLEEAINYANDFIFLATPRLGQRKTLKMSNIITIGTIANGIYSYSETEDECLTAAFLLSGMTLLVTVLASTVSSIPSVASDVVKSFKEAKHATAIAALDAVINRHTDAILNKLYLYSEPILDRLAEAAADGYVNQTRV